MSSHPGNKQPLHTKAAVPFAVNGSAEVVWPASQSSHVRTDNRAVSLEQSPIISMRQLQRHSGSASAGLMATKVVPGSTSLIHWPLGRLVECLHWAMTLRSWRLNIDRLGIASDLLNRFESDSLGPDSISSSIQYLVIHGCFSFYINFTKLLKRISQIHCCRDGTLSPDALLKIWMLNIDRGINQKINRRILWIDIGSLK